MKNTDIYGERPDLKFEGKSSYVTWVGAFFSFVTFILFSVFMAMRTMKLVSRDDPFLSMISRPSDDDTELLELSKLGYRFALEAIDPRVGRWQVK